MFSKNFKALLVAGAIVAVPSVAVAADSYPLMGSSFRVASINGETTRMSSNTVTFAGNTITGRLGCNDFGGNLQKKDEGLSVSALRSTSRVCGDDAAMFEGDGFAVLSQPLKVSWTDRNRLVLASVNGTMLLERLP
jgi:heat shock protein HslJ